jgi:hypothetical protein
MADQRPRGQSPAGPGTNDTSEYAPSKAPDTREHAEERNHDVPDNRLIPGGAHGSPASVGMDSLDHGTVPSGANNTGLTDYGRADEPVRGD